MTANNLLLFRLSEIMLEQQHNTIPVDDLFDDSQIGDFVKSIQIDSPYQQMLLEGVLTETVKDEKLHVSFTVEGYFHFVLGEVIYNHTEGKDAIELKKIVEENQLKGAKEGVEQCLIRDVQKNSLTRLMWLIDESENSLELAVIPLAHAFLSFSIRNVLNELMINLSINDLILLNKVCSYFDKNIKTSIFDEIKREVYKNDALKNFILINSKNELVDKVKEIFSIKEKLNIQLKNENLQYLKLHFQESASKLLATEGMKYRETLDWISFLVCLNALDEAEKLYTRFIEVAMNRKDEEGLILALEQFGDSQYKRSNRDAYQATIVLLTQAIEIRNSRQIFHIGSLKNTYRLLGLVHLSLGLQIVKAIEYLKILRDIILNECAETEELAGIDLYLGLLFFWRGLRGTGRWGHKDESLLDNLVENPFVTAIVFYKEALDITLKIHGKIHPKSLEIFHYLQETTYCVGHYNLAIPYLKQYVSILPLKDRTHTDNYYLYCLIVSLEELAKTTKKIYEQKAKNLLYEALSYARNYDENNHISDRLNMLLINIGSGNLMNEIVPEIDQLAALPLESSFFAEWSKWYLAETMKDFITNPWLIADSGIWFYNVTSKELLQWQFESDNLVKIIPHDWPEAVNRLVYDSNSQTFYAWSSIRSAVYQLSLPYEKWQRLSYGADYAHASGASFGYDPVNKRLFEFGGYGYFTYKNWFWGYDLSDKKWIQLKDNKPGIPPYPRNGQLMPYANGEKLILVSGIGNDTGIQREHKPRRGLGFATDVGYFTWLRDAHVLDLKKMEWEERLSPNHESIRHEGAMGYIESLNCVINWSGSVPSPVFGQEAATVQQLTCWNAENPEGFRVLEFSGDIPPLTGGYFQSIPGKKELLYIHPGGIWKLTILIN